MIVVAADKAYLWDFVSLLLRQEYANKAKKSTVRGLEFRISPREDVLGMVVTKIDFGRSTYWNAFGLSIVGHK